jgi:hypothetical protein
MPGPYEIVLARVQQKKATEAEWLAVEDDLGVILDGEQAFVINDSGVGINFKIGDGTKKFSELPYFITYFSNVLNQKILSYIDQTTDITITSIFRNFSCLYDIVLVNNSGTDIILKVGTSPAADDLINVTVPNGAYIINLRKVFQTVSTVYISGLAGKNHSLFILYFQYDENPAEPPTGGPAVAFKFPRCFKGMYEPLSDTDLDTHWDFTTGLGMPGTAYANCAISGTNGTEEMGRFYPTGWQVGDSLRPATTIGSSSGLITIAENNIPKFRLKMFSGAGPAGQLSPDPTGNKAVAWSSAHTSGNQDYDMKQAGDDNVSMGHTSSFGQDIPDTIDIRPKSKVILFFVAITE